MKKIILVSLLFIGNVNLANCQTNKQFLDYFSNITEDSIVNTIAIMNLDSDILEKNSFPDTIALKRFFNNDKSQLEDTAEGYNVDDNTYIYESIIKKVYPLYKLNRNNTSLLCYIIRSVVYITFYDISQNKFDASLIIADFSDGLGNIYTHSTILPNNDIATVQVGWNASEPEAYYILYKIDYENRKFNELKRIKFDSTQISDYEIKNNIFEALGISDKGELLENTE